MRHDPLRAFLHQQDHPSPSCTPCSRRCAASRSALIEQLAVGEHLVEEHHAACPGTQRTDREVVPQRVAGGVIRCGRRVARSGGAARTPQAPCVCCCSCAVSVFCLLAEGYGSTRQDENTVLSRRDRRAIAPVTKAMCDWRVFARKRRYGLKKDILPSNTKEKDPCKNQGLTTTGGPGPGGCGQPAGPRRQRPGRDQEARELVCGVGTGLPGFPAALPRASGAALTWTCAARWPPPCSTTPQGALCAAERRAALHRLAIRRGGHAPAQHHLDAHALRVAGPALHRWNFFDGQGFMVPQA